MKVSFDFDNTLSKQDVQDYAKNKKKKGVEVFIITARFNELRKSFFKQNPTNDDLWNICYKIGLSTKNVIFCNMEDKSTAILDTDLVWHLDDCWVTLNDINSNTNTPAIDVTKKDWKQKCNKLFEKQKKKKKSN